MSISGGIWAGPHSTNRRDGLHRAPRGVGNDRDAVGQGHDLDHAAHGEGRGGIMAEPRAADGGVEAERGMGHVGERHVDAVVLRAGRFGDNVDPLHRLTEEAPVGGRAQGDICDGIGFCGLGGKALVTEARAIGQDHRAAFGA